jgi:hypothetical protein
MWIETSIPPLHKGYSLVLCDRQVPTVGAMFTPETDSQPIASRAGIVAGVRHFNTRQIRHAIFDCRNSREYLVLASIVGFDLRVVEIVVIAPRAMQHEIIN